MVEITSRDDLESWLQDRPRENAVAIAARAALRVLPLVVTALGRDEKTRRAAIVLSTFRGTAAPWVAAVGPTQGAEVRKATAAAATAATYAVLSVAAHAHAAAAARAAVAAVAAAVRACATDAAATADAAAAAYAAAAAADAAAAWRAVSADAALLERGHSAAELASESLWRGHMPAPLAEAWSDLRKHLLAANEGWEVWTDWYEARLHGHPFDKALEEARVLIDPALWAQGPKAVNAKIARLIAEHPGGPPIPPELPDQRPTPIRFEIRDGALHRAAHEPPHPPEERQAAAQRGWQALREMLDDFLTVGGGGQNRRLRLVLERCQDAMGKSFEALEVILLGAHAARVQGLAERADEVLMPEDAADLVALNAQIALFLAQFPEWADYASGIGDGFGAPAAEQKAVADSTAAIENIAEAAPALIAADARGGLAELAEAAMSEPTADEPAPIAPPIQRRSYLRAVRSALGALAGRAVADVQAGVSKGVQKHVESTTVAALGGAQGHLLALAVGLPGEFGWLAGLITYFTRMLGPSTAGLPTRPGSVVDHDDLTDT